MTGLLQKAIAEMNKLPEREQDEVAAWILEKLKLSQLKAEADWEEAVLDRVLEGVLKPDGDIDFDALRARTQTIPLDALYKESDSDTES